LRATVVIGRSTASAILRPSMDSDWR